MSINDLFNKIAGERKVGGAPEMLIVGLGNYGSKYDDTRHNAGFRAIDYIAEKLGVKINKSKFKSLVCDVEISSKRVLLMKPQTYMNASGTAIIEATDFYKIAPENVIVLHDDISFDSGKIRIRREGSAGGHNGLKNIILHLGHDGFVRLKMGVGEKPKGYDLADYVLGHFSKEERSVMDQAAQKAADAIRMIITQDPDAAMNEFNRKA